MGSEENKAAVIEALDRFNDPEKSAGVPPTTQRRGGDRGGRHGGLPATITGTHRGEFLGVPATDKQVAIGVQNVYRLRDGKVVERWSNADLRPDGAAGRDSGARLASSPN
jgi:hypothetical protein